jgi:hypothetical protein
MNPVESNTDAARDCLRDASGLINAGSNEQAIRDSFTSHLRQIFPTTPSWVVRHIQNSESALTINLPGANTRFVDNLVDLTVIEYESDLRIPSKYQVGLGQVRDYCGRLLNSGSDADFVVGILSDTVRWFAYKIDVSLPLTHPPTLIQIESLDCSDLTERSAADLIRFLIKYLGRIGSRSVTADSVSRDLGFQSRIGQTYIQRMSGIVPAIFNSNKRYANLISDLWSNFVGYLRDQKTTASFDIQTYTDEYYISIVGKLICANYLEGHALSSTPAALREILKGEFFENKGLINFVEYDYFGWLNAEPHIAVILPVAVAIQQDLIAYNFGVRPAEDLFGQLMTQLANRSQRILLGQEWTPGWLSRKLVSEVIQNLPGHEPPRLLDMCCGSGSMIVETVNKAKLIIENNFPDFTKEDKIAALVESITGFDIDPLAVMLSKINWVLSAMDWIEPLGSFQLNIPVFHADSLFAVSPLSTNTGRPGDPYRLRIAEFEVELPHFLISPEWKPFFDRLIALVYRIVTAMENNPTLKIEPEQAVRHMEQIRAETDLEFSKGDEELVVHFFMHLTEVIDSLNKDNRNGIWIYILRNGFMPGLMAGRFNGLVSNPPWLALSKLANNPYKEVLKQKASNYDIMPAGSAHPHTEMATIFLLHAIRNYLVDGAAIGCILPQTILNGDHHHAFREFRFLNAPREPVAFSIREIWKVEEHVFKNEALVLIGNKEMPAYDTDQPITGKMIFSTAQDSPMTFHKNRLGTKSAWSENQSSAAGTTELSQHIPFREGADIMPRNLFFYETAASVHPDMFSVASINRVTSPISFLVRDAKKFLTFSISLRMLPKNLFFDVLISNLLTPFKIAAPQKALLPIRKNNAGIWEAISPAMMMGADAAVQNTFQAISRTLDPEQRTPDIIFEKINQIKKLEQQKIGNAGYLIFTGAGGSKVCAAYLNLTSVDASRLIIDQTLFFGHVATEDEAVFYTGLFNSYALMELIKEFQASGSFGERHIHKLPFSVTPRFDPTNRNHLQLILQTKLLMAEYNNMIAGSPLRIYLDPNAAPVNTSRPKLFNLIKGLPSYPTYERFCQQVYRF